MPRRLRRRVEAVRAATVSSPPGDVRGREVDPVVLTTLAQACRDDERLAFAYAAAGGTAAERTVEPHRLVSLGSRWYLVAYDLERQDWRTFRLDRVRSARGTGERFRQRTLPAEDAAAFVRRGLRQIAPAHEVRALVHAPAADVRPRLRGWADLEDVDAGSCRLRMTTDSLAWAALALGAAEAEVTDVEPPELVVLLRDWSQRLGRAADRVTEQEPCCE